MARLTEDATLEELEEAIVSALVEPGGRYAHRHARHAQSALIDRAFRAEWRWLWWIELGAGTTTEHYRIVPKERVLAALTALVMKGTLEMRGAAQPGMESYRLAYLPEPA